MEKPLRSLELSKYMLFKNMEDRLEWLLTSAYILHLYKLYKLYISDWKTIDLENGKPLEDGKVCCY